MIVVLAIIVTVTAIAILGQSTFNQSLLLTETTYTVGFSLREAQSLGLSSRQFSSVSNAGYGVHFSTLTPSTYLIFADLYPSGAGSALSGVCIGHAVTDSTSPDAKPGNCLYDNSTESVEQFSFSRGFTMGSFCGTVSGSTRCSGSDFDSLDIVFLRPNTVASIIGIRNSAYTRLDDVVIHIMAPGGTAQRCITVSRVGQVAVGNCP